MVHYGRSPSHPELCTALGTDISARPDDMLRAVPTKAFREALMSRYRRLKIEGGAFFFTLALADRGSP